MYGNGVKTGIIVVIIVVVQKTILQDQHRALTASFVAAAGTPMRGSAVCRIVATTIPAAGTTTAVSALPFSNYSYIPSFCTKLENRASLWREANEVRDERSKRNVINDARRRLICRND